MRFRVKAPSTAGGILCVALAIVTLSLHDLAYSLALAFFYPLVLRGPDAWRRPGEWLWPIASSAALAAFYVGWNSLVIWSRTLPVLAAEGGTGAAVAGREVDQLDRSFVALPDMPLLTGMLDRLPLFVPLLVLVAVACALLVTRKLGSPLRERAMLAFVAACAAAQLFNLALLGVFVLAFMKRTGLPALRSREVLLAGALIGATFTIWAVAVLFAQVDLGPLHPLTPRTAIRELLDFPYFYVFWGFPNEWPLAAAVASIGALVAFHRAAHRGDSAAGFALLALSGPIIGNALFASPFEIFRYNAAFNTLFFVFVALAFVHWRELVPAWRPALPRPLVNRTAVALGTTLLVLLVTAYDLNPLRGWLAVERQYSNEGTLYRTFGITAYSDFKTTAAFVARNASPHDLIVTPDSREYYNYLGRVDYWLRSGRYDDQSYTSKGALRDLYIDTPLVKTLPELEAALATPNRTKWVLASTAALADPAVPVAPEIRAFLRNAEQRVVYVGLDRDRKVYRFD